ncbi:MAG: 2,3-epoxybenzoyl-CoA dihydrolase, partial [Stellaceae bacterium]
LMLRANELELGTLLLKTRGSAEAVLASDDLMVWGGGHWFVREVRNYLRRTLTRLDVTSRTLFAIIDQGSCFAGTLLELALAADRSYMLALPEGRNEAPRITFSTANMGFYDTANGRTRLGSRFCGASGAVEAVWKRAYNKPLDATQALDAGLVTAAPDELDWEDEIRLAVEERASLSPDALTGLEANLRFACEETLETKIFGRLSAWQNWIFSRPNAVGDKGALKLFGSGTKPSFNRERV